MNIPIPAGARFAETAASAGSPERALVSRAKAGDRDAFGALHLRYVAMVHAIVLSNAPPRDAADLTQDVFTRALANITTLRSDDSAGAWLASIARNVARDHLRSRRPTVELSDEIDGRSTNRGTLDDANDILDVIKTIPDTYRETLMMRLVEGMNGPEIADRTGMTPGSVRVHLHRGMKMLNEELSKRGLIQ
ncbi:MAG: RNA polymerase sigma factor [Planctomycetota bacterium]